MIRLLQLTVRMREGDPNRLDVELDVEGAERVRRSAYTDAGSLERITVRGSGRTDRNELTLCLEAVGPDEQPSAPVSVLMMDPALRDAEPAPVVEVPSRPHGPEVVVSAPSNATRTIRSRVITNTTSEPFEVENGKRVHLTAEQRDRVNAVIDDNLAAFPCPYGSGLHRGSHEILARRGWHLPAQHMALMLRVGAVLVSGGAGDYAAYVAIADDDAWITDHGNKLGFAEAALMFPGITRERYRP